MSTIVDTFVLDERRALCARVRLSLIHQVPQQANGCDHRNQAHKRTKDPGCVYADPKRDPSKLCRGIAPIRRVQEHQECCAKREILCAWPCCALPADPCASASDKESGNAGKLCAQFASKTTDDRNCDRENEQAMFHSCCIVSKITFLSIIREIAL